MKRFFSGIVALMVGVLMVSCGDDADTVEKDMEKPVISDDKDSYPENCQVYERGDVVPLRCKFTDNMELGNYNIEIHNNFDHHSHGTVAGDCVLEEKKKPVNPWVYNKSFDIPAGQRAFEAKVDIPIPTDIDAGDYHFMVRLTDRSGWQELKAISIKVK
ncbi:DUF4625 domain-containing protein [Prevotella sp.]|uniref:DUF4625 domain-containing protein n=1 Tax=Prevotella sp. TaxID=59823 RepID=UPI0039C45844